MDTTGNESQAVAAEIEAAHGALEADALEARVETAELVKEAMKEVRSQVVQEVFAPLSPVTPAPAAPPPKPEVKAAPEAPPKEVAKQAEPIKATEEVKEGKPEPKAQAKEQEPAPITSKGEQKHELSTSAFKALKAKAEEKGRRSAMDDVTKALTAAGFSSLEEAFAAIKKASVVVAQQAPVAAPAPVYVAPAVQAAPPADPVKNTFMEAELRKATRERDRMAQELSAERTRAEQESKRRKQMVKKMEAMEVDQELREAAVSTGVQDVDYAMTLLQRELATKTDEQLAVFDDRAYFQNLRGSHGYLFGEKQELAHTGNAAGMEPAAPPSARQTQSQVVNNAKPKDALKMPLNELQVRLKELGLTSPSS